MLSGWWQDRLAFFQISIELSGASIGKCGPSTPYRRYEIFAAVAVQRRASLSMASAEWSSRTIRAACRVSGCPTSATFAPHAQGFTEIRSGRSCHAGSVHRFTGNSQGVANWAMGVPYPAQTVCEQRPGPASRLQAHSTGKFRSTELGLSQSASALALTQLPRKSWICCMRVRVGKRKHTSFLF